MSILIPIDFGSRPKRVHSWASEPGGKRGESAGLSTHDWNDSNDPSREPGLFV